MADMGEEGAVAQAPVPVAFVPDMPEIKLFGKWSLEEVQLNDMSLQVSLICFILFKRWKSYKFICLSGNIYVRVKCSVLDLIIFYLFNKNLLSIKHG